MLKNSGILTLEPECVLKTDEVEIVARFAKKFGNIQLNIPNLNLTELNTININFTKVKPDNDKLEFTDFNGEFLKIQEQAEGLETKVQEAITDNMAIGQIANYSGISFSFIIIFIIIIYIVWRCIMK